MRLIPARTIKRHTADGLCELQDEAPVGREYLVDVDAPRIAGLQHESGVYHEKEIVLTYEVSPEGASCTGWLPVELLEIQD